MDPLYSQVLDRAASIAKTIGAIEYMNDRARGISKSLESASTLPERLLIKQPNRGMVPFDVRRWEVRPGVRRFVSAKDLKAKYPHAYRAVVTVTKPEKVYQVRLDANKGGVKATEWAAIKAATVAEWEAYFLEKHKDTVWGSGALLTSLHDLRSRKDVLVTSLEAKRDELTSFIVEHELPLVIPGRTDGRVVLRENADKMSVDYDKLEKEFPHAATLIKRTPQPGGIRIALREFVPDRFDDGDEEEW